MKVPPGAICTEVTLDDPSREYRYKTLANLQTIGENSDLANIHVPMNLVYMTLDGNATQVTCGNLYVSYSIELSEPIMSSLNV